MTKSTFLIFATALMAMGITAKAQEKLEGTPIGTSAARAAYAFDGKFTTVYTADKGSYAWVGLDLGEPFVISRVGWASSGANTKAVVLGMFQGANKADFSDAIPIYLNDIEGQYGRMDYGDVNCSRGFRYVRYVGPADSSCRIAELEFYGTRGKGDDSHLWQITNLPTVVINTVNDEIPYDKENDISSTVIIISENGAEALEKSETLVRERGNASRQFPKKPWRIKFDKKQQVLDSPAKAKKWTLINNYGDKTLMRNMLAFDIARKMGMEYVPFCRPVDVVLNGEYKGCYQLCDQVEVNSGRVDIDEMEKTDTSGEALTGGYLIEIDAYAYEEASWFQSAHYGIPVTIKSPDDDEIQPSQRNYITSYFNNLENLMKDTDPVTGYRSVFDNTSFIQHMLTNELAGNTDCYWSTYMYKRRGDPHIYTGPVWDFDLGFNNDNRTFPVYTRSGNGFLWNSGYASGANGMLYFAQRILIKDESTPQEILSVWAKARLNGLTTEWLQSQVDSYAELLDASQRLNFMRWPILNEYVHQNPVVFSTYQAGCEAVKNYIKLQMNHLDAVVGYDPNNPPQDGVEDVESDFTDGGSVFYTLQGVRIDKPTVAGMYIQKTGTHTTKVLIR